jgi:hemerythrin-like domain-containing protein
MLVQLGQRQSGTDVVDLLVECHGRIRRFLDIAQRLAAATEMDAATVRDAAGRVCRYFAEAFPLHLADEDELVLPALLGTGEHVDDALTRMSAEHQEHAALVTEMIDACASLHADPRCIVAAAPRLGSVTSALRGVLEPHLAAEEREIFPALRTLPEATRAGIRAGMQARRSLVLSKTAHTIRR